MPGSMPGSRTSDPNAAPSTAPQTRPIQHAHATPLHHTPTTDASVPITKSSLNYPRRLRPLRPHQGAPVTAGRVRTISIPSALKTSSKHAPKRLSRSCTRKRIGSASLDGEELLPGRSTARSWSETVASKDPADRARRDADPWPAKLALNANTSPAAVLPAEADNELDELIVERRIPGPCWARQRFHLRRESSRCQLGRASGVTRKQPQRHPGSTRLSAASITRSAGR